MAVPVHMRVAMRQLVITCLGIYLTSAQGYFWGIEHLSARSLTSLQHLAICSTTQHTNPAESYACLLMLEARNAYA